MVMNELTPQRPANRLIQSILFGAIFIILFLVVCRLFVPFFTALLWSILLYIIIRPLHHKVIRKINTETIKGKILKNIWAVVFTLGTMIVIFIPLSIVASMLLRQIAEFGRSMLDFMNKRPQYLFELYETISDYLRNISAGLIEISPHGVELQVQNVVANELQRIVLLSSNIVKYIGSFSISMLVMVFSMYFFYIDGSYLAQLVLRAIPIKKEYIKALTSKFMDITRNLFLGYIMVALLQSVVAFIIFTIFGIERALLLAVVTFILVFIPVVGATLVYIPLTIFKIASGSILSGIIFFIVSVIFLSGIDNVLRPFFLRDRIQLHPLIIFFAILGGLAAFGFNGFILGPVFVILFLTVLDLFLIEHKIDQKDQQGSS
jgi:predicted PurR-regulated permease PerM